MWRGKVTIRWGGEACHPRDFANSLGSRKEPELRRSEGATFWLLATWRK
jgi:hypothetical protein